MDLTKADTVSLDNLGGGAAVEKFNDEPVRSLPKVRHTDIRTDPTMLVYNATEQPWTDDYGVIVSPHRERAICNLEPRDYKIENAMLICAAPPLLKVAQKLLLWMEECMAACDFNQEDIDLYHELRQTIRTAGGFSSDTHWWQGPCICDACGHAWQGVVEIPVEASGPQVPLECGECHQMTGGPA